MIPVKGISIPGGGRLMTIQSQLFSALQYQEITATKKIYGYKATVNINHLFNTKVLFKISTGIINAIIICRSTINPYIELYIHLESHSAHDAISDNLISLNCRCGTKQRVCHLKISDLNENIYFCHKLFCTKTIKNAKYIMSIQLNETKIHPPLSYRKILYNASKPIFNPFAVPYNDGINFVDNNRFQIEIVQFAIYGRDNGLNYKVYELLMEIASSIQEFSSPNKVCRFASKNEIKSFIESMDDMTVEHIRYWWILKGILIILNKWRFSGSNNRIIGYNHILYNLIKIRDLYQNKLAKTKDLLFERCFNYNNLYHAPWIIDNIINMTRYADSIYDPKQSQTDLEEMKVNGGDIRSISEQIDEREKTQRQQKQPVISRKEKKKLSNKNYQQKNDGCSAPVNSNSNRDSKKNKLRAQCNMINGYNSSVFIREAYNLSPAHTRLVYFFAPQRGRRLICNLDKTNNIHYAGSPKLHKMDNKFNNNDRKRHKKNSRNVSNNNSCNFLISTENNNKFNASLLNTKYYQTQCNVNKNENITILSTNSLNSTLNGICKFVNSLESERNWMISMLTNRDNITKYKEDLVKLQTKYSAEVQSNMYYNIYIKKMLFLEPYYEKIECERFKLLTLVNNFTNHRSAWNKSYKIVQLNFDKNNNLLQKIKKKLNSIK